MIKGFEEFSAEHLKKYAEASNTEFYESLEYSLFSGGKRFRPKLILALGTDLKIPAESLYPAALAVELIHTYSLVHDDLPAMDNDLLRRGKPTHHAKFGEASAVLAGDTYLTMAFEVLATYYSGELLSNLILLLSKTAGAKGMIGGQVLDCMTNERSKEIFEKIHVLKTGMLFSFSTAAPAIVDRQKEVHAFESLGKEIGVLFQLQDDLFDEAKKDERTEENILSIVSKDELITLIEKRKKRVLKLMEDQDLDEKSEFFKLIKFLFDREY